MEQDTDDESEFHPEDDLEQRIFTRLARVEVDHPWRTQEMKETDAQMRTSQPGPRSANLTAEEIENNPYFVNPAMVKSDLNTYPCTIIDFI